MDGMANRQVGRLVVEMRALVLSEAGDLSEVDLLARDGDSLTGLQTCVGGLIDVVRLGDTLDMWLNDEGMYLCPINPVATIVAGEIFAAQGQVLRQAFYGPAVFTGGANNEGETLPLADDEAKLLRELVTHIHAVGIL